MVLSILFISVTLPIITGISCLFVSKRLPNLQPLPCLIPIIAWLPIYAWIVHFPQLIPKQALDWLWIYIGISALPSLYTPMQTHVSHWRVSYCSAVFLIISLFMIWPAITYQASWETHSLVWLESLLFTVLGMFILSKAATAPVPQPNQLLELNLVSQSHLYLWLVNGAMGITVIVTGSLLVGMLLISLSAIFFSSGVYTRLNKNFVMQNAASHLPISFGLSLLILLIARVYVELDFLNLFLFISSIVLVQQLSGKPYLSSANKLTLQLVFLGSLSLAITYTVMTELFNNSNNAYY